MIFTSLMLAGEEQSPGFGNLWIGDLPPCPFSQQQPYGNDEGSDDRDYKKDFAKHGIEARTRVHQERDAKQEKNKEEAVSDESNIEPSRSSRPCEGHVETSSLHDGKTLPAVITWLGARESRFGFGTLTAEESHLLIQQAHKHCAEDEREHSVHEGERRGDFKSLSGKGE